MKNIRVLKHVVYIAVLVLAVVKHPFFQTANYFEALKFGLRFNSRSSGLKPVSVSCFESESVPIPD